MTEYSPLLRFPLVAPNQNQKEATINTATTILEAAANATLAVNMTAGHVELTHDQFTRNMLFRCQGHSASRILFVPDTSKLFIVSNEGSEVLNVRADISASGQVTVPAGKIVIIMGDSDTVRAVSSGVGLLTDLGDVDVTGSFGPGNGDVLQFLDGFWVPGQFASSTFLGLLDTPATFVGQALKVVRVNAAANALEFFTLGLANVAGFPAFGAPEEHFILRVASGGAALEWAEASEAGSIGMGDLTDVDLGTALADGDILVLRGGIWEPETKPDLFLKLLDTPITYVGQAKKHVRVKADVSGLEFEDPPFDIGVFIPGELTPNAIFWRFVATRAFELPDNFTGSVGRAGETASSALVINVKKNGSTIGTVTFVGAINPVFSTSGVTAETFVAGDRLELEAPATPDDWSDISITFKGKRTD